jgi:glutamyl-tRNA reductase
MSLSLIGINHNTAPVEMREKVVFDSNTMVDDLRLFQQKTGVSELAILATCNRTEVYFGFQCDVQCKDDACHLKCQKQSKISPRVLDYLHQHSHFPKDSLSPFLYEYHNSEMIRHTMRVASGLNSMIIGEPQILGQMKQCFHLASQAGTLKNKLQRLFQHIFSAAKKVRSETGIGTEPISIASAAVKLIAQFYTSLEDKKVLLIGAGDTIRLVSQHIDSLSAKNFIVANRSLDKALELVQKDKSRAIPLEQMKSYLTQADVVVSCTSSRERIIDNADIEQAMKMRPERRLVLIDLGVPRDIDPDVAKNSQVYLYSVDDLSNIVKSSLRNRQHKVKQADEIINVYEKEFTRWVNLQNNVSTVDALRHYGDEQRQQLIYKYTKKLQKENGENIEETLQQFATQLNNTLMHSPTAALRDAIEENDIEKIALIRSLFNRGNQ